MGNTLMHPAFWTLLVGLSLTTLLATAAEDEQRTTVESQSSQLPPNKVSAAHKNQLDSSPAAVNGQPPIVSNELEFIPPPPSIGAPADRVAGGVRGPGGPELRLVAFAPNHVGLTVREQPVLYWHLTQTTTLPIEFTLVEEEHEKPIVVIFLDAPTQPGVQRVQLRGLGIRLTPGVRYLWSVAVILDPKRRSKDILVRGAIQRLEFPDALRARLVQAAKTDELHSYAARGLWYDTCDALIELLAASPGDAMLLRQRASLLKQAELPEVD